MENTKGFRSMRQANAKETYGEVVFPDSVKLSFRAKRGIRFFDQRNGGTPADA
jgi:hypothetical protein